MTRKTLLVIVVSFAIIFAGIIVAAAQGPKPGRPLHTAAIAGTGFTYQGQLKQSGAPVNGSRSLAFRLYDVPSGGSPLGAITQTITITDGLFTTQLGFGSQFNGDARYLAIAVGADPELTPRQPLTAAPYALYSTGNWGLNGNASTTFGNYLGTSDGMSLTLGVGGAAALRIYPNATSPNLIGGFSGNVISPGVVGATIGGGGDNGELNSILSNADYGTIGGGHSNVVSNTFATIGGGGGNTAGGYFATVAGGRVNSASGDSSTVGGGGNNTASADSSTVGGGSGNLISGMSDDHSTIAGGHNNLISGTFAWESVIGGGDGNAINGSNVTWGVIGGGLSNVISGTAQFATISGGRSNTASGNWSTVSGGHTNTASGDSSAVGGGYNNTASGDYSFAAGNFARANQSGAFVWSDSHPYDFNSGGNNQFDVRATGGISLVTSINITGTPTSGVFVDGAGVETVSGLKVASNGTLFNRMQAGTATLGGSLNTGVNVYTVTFPVAFTMAPKVMLTARGNTFGGGPVSDTFAVTTRAVTASYYVVNVYYVSGNGAGWAQSLQLDWFAWE